MTFETKGTTRNRPLQKIETGGPVARALFGGGFTNTNTTIRNDLKSSFHHRDSSFADQAFLIGPLVRVNPEPGQLSLQRTDYQAELFSSFIAAETIDLAVRNFDTFKLNLAKLFEGLIRRAFKHGGELPSGFGGCRVAQYCRLLGRADQFVCSPTPTRKRPLYLQPPQCPSFAPVDAILVTRSVLGFMQSSPPEPHSGGFARMLGIMLKLTGILDYIKQVLYCLVGTDVERVQSRVKGTRRMLVKLQKLNTDQLCDELGLPIAIEVASKGLLRKFKVVGYTFHAEYGLEEFE